MNSKSISDVITRLVAINKVVSANAKMLEQQKADKASLEEKQTANQEAINTIAANMSAIKENQNALRTQQADLEVAKVNLAIQLASAEDEKASLLNQQAAAQQAAAEALAAQQAAQAKAREEAAQQAASVEAAKSAITPAPQATPAAQSSNAIEPAALTAPASPSARPQVSYSSVNNYPVGQCTWGAKSLAPWAGNNWGNGGQWAASAQAAGYSVGSTPMVGAIAVWNDGGYGHVAVVVEVQSSSNIRVMESNYSGKQYIADHRGWFNPTGVTFIYPH